MEKKDIPSKTIYCFGDSGSGKTSFINCFEKAEDKEICYKLGQQTQTSMITTFLKDIGYLNFVDSIGTNNPEGDEDYKAFLNLYEIAKNNPKHQIDAVLYFHDCNERSRFYGNIRLALLQKQNILENFQPPLNCILICTKYVDLAEKNQSLFNEFVSKYRSNFSSVILWDSIDIIPQQFLNFQNALKLVQPINVIPKNLNPTTETNCQDFASPIYSAKIQEEQSEKANFNENLGNQPKIMNFDEKMYNRNDILISKHKPFNENTSKNNVLTNISPSNFLGEKNIIQENPSQNNVYPNISLPSFLQQKVNSRKRKVELIGHTNMTIKENFSSPDPSKFSTLGKEETQRESILIFPDYPAKGEDKKIIHIAVRITRSVHARLEYNIIGQGEPTGKVVFKMIYRPFKLDYSEIDVQIQYSYCYTLEEKEIFLKNEEEKV